MKWLIKILSKFVPNSNGKVNKKTKSNPVSVFREDLIRDIQEHLNLVVDGIPGNNTITAIARAFDCNSNMFDIQRAIGVKSNANDDVKTWKRIKEKLQEISKTDTKPLVQGISKKAYDLIVYYESGGKSYYEKHLKSPSYPGGASGVTIGIGYDLGYNTIEQFTKDWKGLLSKDDFTTLSNTLGKKGERARVYLKRSNDLKNISISWEAALKVFQTSTLPRFIATTKKVFPGSEKLNADTFGVLVSLVFNRGGSLKGNRRKEMLNIHNAIESQKEGDALHEYIANQIVEMKRIWKSSGLKGLLARREAEAKLIVKSIA